VASPKKPAQKAKPLSKPAKARAAWASLHSAFRTPHSAFRTPHSSFVTRHSSLVILLSLASLLLRLAGLGHRAMSHDESLHTLYSWYLSSSFHYEHDPMMHGPLLFHLNALIYTLFGATDFTSRLAPALMGAACVPAVGLLYKRWLGATGSLISAALVAISPGLLYYSRYIRNDIYIALFTLILFWAALRYRETAAPKYLLWLSGSLALSFACKEVAYIHGTVLGAATVLFALMGFHSNRSLHCADRRWGDIAVTLLTLALPFATALPLALFGADPTASRDPFLQRLALLTALTLSSVSWGMATLWFKEKPLFNAWTKAFTLFWGIQILLYSTLLSNLPQGLTSGIASGLGYWLAQHEVQRGASDPLFYLSLLLLYTPLLLLSFFLRLKHFREPFTLLALLWTLGNFVIYSIAGERMPWLLIHITLPLCLLAGPAITDAFATRSRIRLLLIPLAAHLVINSLRAVGPLAESPNEPLFYAHAGPHIKTALRILDSHHQHQPDSLIHIDPDFTWPLAWYLREHPVIYSPLPQPDAAIRITSPHREPFYTEQGWTPRGEFELIHWPRQQWHALTLSNFRRLATSARVRRNFLRFYFFRDFPALTPEDFPQPVRFTLLTREHGE
jgi:uncharacterized protein (TIGR03663 family)